MAAQVTPSELTQRLDALSNFLKGNRQVYYSQPLPAATAKTLESQFVKQQHSLMPLPSPATGSVGPIRPARPVESVQPMRLGRFGQLQVKKPGMSPPPAINIMPDPEMYKQFLKESHQKYIDGEVNDLVKKINAGQFEDVQDSVARLKSDLTFREFKTILDKVKAHYNSLPPTQKVKLARYATVYKLFN